MEPETCAAVRKFRKIERNRKSRSAGRVLPLLSPVLADKKKERKRNEQMRVDGRQKQERKIRETMKIEEERRGEKGVCCVSPCLQGCPTCNARNVNVTSGLGPPGKRVSSTHRPRQVVCDGTWNMSTQLL